MGTTPRPASRRREGLVALTVVLCAAMVGLSIFGALAWRAVTIRRADASGALRRFTAIRARLPTTSPWCTATFRADWFGATRDRVKARVRHACEYSPIVSRRNASWRWTFRCGSSGVKGPAMQFALRGTSIEFQSLGVTAADLQRAGAAVVLDETRSNGDRILAWTE